MLLPVVAARETTTRDNMRNWSGSVVVGVAGVCGGASLSV